MNFLNLAGFGLALLLPVIVLMYLLKLRRDERQVSSTYLWRRMVRDVQANAPWQRLQRNLLLLLQLLFLSALILAIARPASQSSGISNQSLILIIDASASMAARDVEPSRIEAAKRAAIDLIASLSTDARVTVIAAGARPHTLISLSTDRRAANQAISEIEVEAGGSDMASALQIAAAIARRQPDNLTVMLSDGNNELPQHSSLPGNFRYVSVGQSEQNQSIELLSIKQNPADASLSAFAQVANYSSQPVSRRLGFFADGVLLSASDLDIQPGAEQSALVSGIDGNVELVEARLLESNQTKDYLPLDDRALAVNRQAEPVKAILTGESNLFLETALSLIPSLELTVINPGDPINPDAGLVVLNGVVPAGELPQKANLFYIAPPESTEFFTITGTLDLPNPVKVEPVDPMVANVDFSGVNILDALKVQLPQWAAPVIEDKSSASTPRYPLLFYGEIQGRRVAVLAFNLNHSDLPLQVAFPILVSNLMTWLAPGSGNTIPASIQPGAPVSLAGLLRSEAGARQSLRITRPDGSFVEIDSTSEDPVFVDTGQLGLYSISTADGKEIRFAVNLFAPQESRIAPSQSVQVTGVENPASNTSSFSATREWWRLAALLAVGLLTVEWLVYHRATLSELGQRLRSMTSRTSLYRK